MSASSRHVSISIIESTERSAASVGSGFVSAMRKGRFPPPPPPPESAPSSTIGSMSRKRLTHEIECASSRHESPVLQEITRCG